MKNKLSRAYWFAITAITVSGLPLLAAGVPDADVQQTVDDLTATWAIVKTAAVAILVFLLCIGLLKKGFRRAT